MIDFARYLQLKANYETRKATLLEELGFITPIPDHDSQRAAIKIQHSRRSMIEEQAADEETERQQTNKQSLIDRLCDSMSANRLTPIIGDTVRHERIFDIDSDKVLGVAANGGGHAGAARSELGTTVPSVFPASAELSGAIPILPQRKLSITEQLAVLWAKKSNYPLADRHRIARVAQYNAVKMGVFNAKKDYLKFQKTQLLEEVIEAAEKENMPDVRAHAEHLKNNLKRSFTDIVEDLGLCRRKKGSDPLDILARWPIRCYVTTSYYDFVERALEAANKKPRTRLCLWNLDVVDLRKEHKPADDDWEPSAEEPIVYHLFGSEHYPESMLLCEDDYVEYLMYLAQDKVGDSGDRFILPFVESRLRNSSLLLLGYRLHDWDFRVLLRVLRKAKQTGKKSSGRSAPDSVAIQLDAKDQFEITKDDKAKENATEYLTGYFDEAKLKVDWDRTDSFLETLWTQCPHKK